MTTNNLILFLLGVYIALTLLIYLLILKRKNKLKLKDRLDVSVVKPGQSFRLEYDKAQYKICTGYCISNDLLTKKIYFKIVWKEVDSEPYEQPYLFGHNNKAFDNFHILNVNDFSFFSDENYEIQKIQNQIEDLLKLKREMFEHEEYEKIPDIQNEINELTKKLK